MNKTVKKIITLLLVLGMCLPTISVRAAERVQTVLEGSEISLSEGNKVESLSALLTDQAQLEDWFEVGNLRVTKVQKNVFHIDEGTEAFPTGILEDGSINNGSSMYLIIDGNEVILIDGGNSAKTNAGFSNDNNTNLRLILDELVYGPQRALQVIIAHKHGDHIGALTVDTVIEKGTPMYIHEDDYSGIRSVTNIYEVDTFKQGDVLGTSNFKMEVVDIPGHTDGSCALVNKEKEIVFTDDALGSSLVYLFGEVEDLYYGARNLYEMIKDMDNPILYCGHRWQQFAPYISATEEINMGEVGKQYVLEYIALFENILKGDYQVNTDNPHGGNLYYSENSDLNKDGKFPGFKGTDAAIERFIAQNKGINAKNSVEEGSTISLEEGSQVESLKALETAALEDWFEVGCLRVTKVQEGVLHIDEATSHANAGYQKDDPSALNNPSSMYLILDADEAILIDGGNSTKTNGEFSATLNADLKTILTELVDKKYRELEVIIAHKHGDHIGAFTTDEVIPLGTPMYVHEDDYAGIKSVTAIYEVETFKQGDVLGTTDFRMEVVDVPGHTDGSCALINREREVIFTDDALGSGTVWLGDLESLQDFEYGVNNLWSAIKDMTNPILYCGHRWQQYEAVASASGKVVVGEVGKQYVLEYVELMNLVKAGNYSANTEYVSGVGFYSDAADLNKDGRMPGFKATLEAVEEYSKKQEETPDTPVVPENPTPEKPDQPTDTGDNSPVGFYIVGAAIALVAVVVLLKPKKENI